MRESRRIKEVKCSWIRALRRRGVCGAGSGVDESGVSSMLGMYSLTAAVLCEFRGLRCSISR